ncbi:MAG: glycosyltransferase, partial [Brevundimonas sp.]
MATWSTNPFAHALYADGVRRHHDRAAAQAQREPDGGGRPRRLLIVTSQNWNFLTNLLDHYAQDDSAFEVRTFDFSSVQEALDGDIHAIFAPQSMGVSDEAMWARISALSPTFRELVEWSDTVLCEWAGAHALWLSRYLPSSARLVIRLHSYEVFSQWPLFMNWGGVDGVVFVADHIRQFARLQYGLDRYDWIDTTVVPNFNHLEKFLRPKTSRAARTLGMVGYNNWNKDPLFGVRVLEALAAEDPDWRLVLVGHPWTEDSKPKEAAYRAAFHEAVEQAGLADRIEYRGHTRDLPAVFEDIGFVLSTSWREGTHETILEGMASGAVPVIRRWPMTQPFGAPET